ncbi:hypothetical protein [Paenibacillus pectinilyticus]|uniref:hypothetical protein n=1 Tax=Paenibacillus pectinilyticus TaxID=512399 RepID=UPI000A856D98|nr:hypothetical protein [Paenibacillus pectinilyticus]
MGRRRGVMSESLKSELAKDLGFYDVVQREGWAGIRTKDAGNMVKRAIQIAEEHLAKQYASSSVNTQASPSTYRQPSVAQPMYNGASYTPSYGSYYQPQSVSVNHLIAGSHQANQGAQRPYYS